MTVYFISRTDDPSQVKIGVTVALDRRLTSIAASFENGIELLAQCPGDARTESAFHALCMEQRQEGEWFENVGPVRDLVRRFAGNVTGRRMWGRPRAVQAADDPIMKDREIAFGALLRLLDTYGRTMLSTAIERAFQDLHAVNPRWTRRRVRSLWERAARRIDLYELRDIEGLLARTEWAEINDVAGKGSRDE